MSDDRVTGYATENVEEPTPAEREAMTAWLDAIDWANEHVCPIRDCPGHPGPHGGLWA